MDGDLANLKKLVELKKKHGAYLFVDECHATGVLGKSLRGTPELYDVEQEVDVVNSTLGKAMGGGTGGYTTGKKEVIELLRQKGRPYLFSNSIAPSVVAGSMQAYTLLERD
mmetsp:Transcript_17043/g.37549  ORF Transcript_17043/g.37549 Transcript_17043/m.37549 type:complete len:111 (+) Transcript_17043:584-916(+)